MRSPTPQDPGARTASAMSLRMATVTVDRPTAPPPLGELPILDFSRVLAGPFATMMLADLGARVVKVERPGTGDDSRSYGPFAGGRSLCLARVNRGKESVALDLKDPADLRVARSLA